MYLMHTHGNAVVSLYVKLGPNKGPVFSKLLFWLKVNGQPVYENISEELESPIKILSFKYCPVTCLHAVDQKELSPVL